MPKRSADANQYDPLFLNSRREAAVIFALWLFCLLWSVPYCYLNGYPEPGAKVPLVLGMPAWIVWGIVVPWGIANVVTIWFCFGYFKDEDLGPVMDEHLPPDSPS